jgi:hypothetical protein
MPTVTLNQRTLQLESILSVRDLRVEVGIPAANRVLVQETGGRMRQLHDDDTVGDGAKLYHLPVPLFS